MILHLILHTTYIHLILYHERLEQLIILNTTCILYITCQCLHGIIAPWLYSQQAIYCTYIHLILYHERLEQLIILNTTCILYITCQCLHGIIAPWLYSQQAIYCTYIHLILYHERLEQLIILNTTCILYITCQCLHGIIAPWLYSQQAIYCTVLRMNLYTYSYTYLYTDIFNTLHTCHNILVTGQLPYQVAHLRFFHQRSSRHSPTAALRSRLKTRQVTDRLKSRYEFLKYASKANKLILNMIDFGYVAIPICFIIPGKCLLRDYASSMKPKHYLPSRKNTWRKVTYRGDDHRVILWQPMHRRSLWAEKRD